MISTAEFDTERMAAAADAELLVATDLAEHLVRNGVPFRQAHAEVGQLVRRHLSGEGQLRALAITEIGPECAPYFEPGGATNMRTSPGGAGPSPVAVQIAAFAEKLSESVARLNELG